MERRIFLGTFATGASIGLPRIGQACLWDRDTLTDEAKRFPGLVPILTGRFVRYPERYYAMRIDRLAGEIEARPNDLALYDDLAVAHDRIHQSDVAVTWMERKSAAMERLHGEISTRQYADHLYRFHSNLGTFLIHGWLANGGQPSVQEVPREAFHQIHTALKLNPNAHFGRELYQLMAIDWIVRRNADPETSPLFLAEVDKFREKHDLEAVEPKEPAIGTAGMVYLGSAWQSVDIFNNLAWHLHRTQQGHLSQLAHLRATEIRSEGGKSLAGEIELSRPMVDRTPWQKNETFFWHARREANEWHASRMAFLQQQFSQGRHPDTEKDFWSDWKYDGSPPKFNGKTVA